MAASKRKQFVNKTRNDSLLADRAKVADCFFTRLVGLLSSAPLQKGEGLLIEPCSSIHMLGMKFSIDVVFIDKNWHVVGLLHDFPPGRISRVYKSARRCIELPAGAIVDSGTELGDLVEMTDAQAL